MSGMLGLATISVGGTVPESPGLSIEISLEEWGMKVPADIGYVSAGILHEPRGDRLVVYEISSHPPVLSSPVPARRRAPEADDGLFLVSRFEQGNVNALGGYFNCFARKPAQSHVTLSNTPEGPRSLRFSYFNQLPGYAGFWVHLFDMKKPPRQRVYLDARSFSHLAFEVRGELGGERILLKVADHGWEAREDAIPLGEVGSFLGSRRIETAWQQARVPLGTIPASVDRKTLASLVFEAMDPSAGRIFVRDLAFVQKRKLTVPKPAAPHRPERPLRRALWVWETEELISDPSEVRRVLNLCEDLGITDVFLQIPFQKGISSEKPSLLWNQPATADLVRGMHHRNLAVHALDGDPRFALSDWHPEALARVQSVVAYNAAVETAARFDGFRFDNEPYLLSAYGGPGKESILRQYLDLLQSSRDLLAPAGIAFGVDLPFWFDARDDFFRPVAELAGRSVSEHVIDIADNVGLMAYRTHTYGPDGVLEIARGELEYASKQGKKVFVGLETVELPDETLFEFGRSGKGSSLYIESSGPGKARIRWVPADKSLQFAKTLDPSKGGVLFRQLRATPVPADKITFARRGMAAMDEVVRELAWELAPLPGFAGFAFHSYEGLRALPGTGSAPR